MISGPYHLTLSVQDDEGQPMVSVGARIEIEITERVKVSDHFDVGFGATVPDAIADWIRSRLRRRSGL